VDENTKTVHVNIETSTFPNLVGAPNQRRIITCITADEMKFTACRGDIGNRVKAGEVTSPTRVLLFADHLFVGLTGLVFMGEPW
jgi:hypothetical protein